MNKNSGKCGEFNKKIDSTTGKKVGTQTIKIKIPKCNINIMIQEMNDTSNANVINSMYQEK